MVFDRVTIVVYVFPAYGHNCFIFFGNLIMTVKKMGYDLIFQDHY